MRSSRTFWSPELHGNWKGLNLANILSSANVWQIGAFIPITNWQSTRNHQKQFTKLNNVKSISAHENTWKAMCDFIQSERTCEDQLRTKFLNSAFFDQCPDYSIQKDILPRKTSHWGKSKDHYRHWYVVLIYVCIVSNHSLHTSSRNFHHGAQNHPNTGTKLSNLHENSLIMLKLHWEKKSNLIRPNIHKHVGSLSVHLLQWKFSGKISQCYIGTLGKFRNQWHKFFPLLYSTITQHHASLGCEPSSMFDDGMPHVSSIIRYEYLRNQNSNKTQTLLKHSKNQLINFMLRWKNYDAVVALNWAHVDRKAKSPLARRNCC